MGLSEVSAHYGSSTAARISRAFHKTDYKQIVEIIAALKVMYLRPYAREAAFLLPHTLSLCFFKFSDPRV